MNTVRTLQPPLSLEEEEVKITSCSILPFRIVPAGFSQKTSSAFDAHLQEMLYIIKKILAECSLVYRNNKQFWDNVKRHIPIVHWEPCEQAPGGVTLYLLCRALTNYDQAHFFSEMIVRWLVPEKQTTILRSKQLAFRFVDAPEESFFVAEIFALVEDERSFKSFQKNIPALAQEIALGAVSAHHARHILMTKSLTQGHKTTLIHKTIVEYSTRRFKTFGSDLFFEMHHFLLASDDEFKRIRNVRHMCRIIYTHNWFRKVLRRSKQTERQAFVKVCRTNLHFQFGEKNVLGLVISLSFLKEYEQFEARHIAVVCQRIMPSISAVPRSFFSYQNPTDPIACFYIEIERVDGSLFTSSEIALIKRGLEHEIPHSIEQLSHTLFMPHNEEEIMRNTLLLSHEIRFVRDMPQMIITFQGQSDTSLRFHVTLVRLLKNQATTSIDDLFTKVSELIDYISGSKKIIGFLRNKYPKEANTFTLECLKSHFMRLDHSVDLSRAREFIAATIRKAVGDVRDFNGGLMSQQNKLLESIKELLSQQERKEEIHLENLFHTMQPVLLRCLLPPQLSYRLFQHFLVLHHERPENPYPRISDSIACDAYCVVVCSEDADFLDNLHKHIFSLGFKEQELASSKLVVDGLTYFGYIFSCKDSDRLQAFKTSVSKVVSDYTRAHRELKAIRISLPRPTSSLDPRIGTDRTSGIVIKMLYDGLMRIDQSGKPTFAVAANVTISTDQRHYVFTLKKTKWTNGAQVTAHDFEYGWKKVLDPNFRAPFAYLFYPIKNARLVKLGVTPIEELGVQVLDDYTLEVELEHPAPYFLEHCAHWIYSPLCKQVDQLHPGWAYYGDDTYVSNGPFRLTRWKQSSEILLVKNMLYWDADSVQLHQVDISIVEDPNRALTLYQRGELDWIGEPLSEIPPEVFKIRNFESKISFHPISAVHWYSCNLKFLPLSSKKCRKALAMAINRAEINNRLFQGLEQTASSILPPRLSQLDAPLFTDGDYESAERLFHEGLQEVGLQKRDLAPFMITCCDQEVHRSIAIAVCRQFKDVLGIETRVESYKWDRFMEKCWQHDFQIMGMTWYSWIFDPSYNLQHLHSLSHEMNFAQWHNPLYTKLLDKAQACVDTDKRLEYLRQAEEIVMEEIPVIPLFYYTFKYMKKEHLDNIYLSHLGQIDFKWTTICQHQKLLAENS